jgi:hexosaminidase
VVNSLGKMKKRYLFVILLICNVFFISAQSINKIAPIIPMPNKIDFGNGSIDFNIETILIKKNSPEVKKLAQFYIQLFQNPNIQIQEVDKLEFTQKNSIILGINERRDAPDRYKIQVTPYGIMVEASQVKGLFHALQSLTQLVKLNPENKAGSIRIPTVIIEDEPRFSYRGMHLDVARHFFSVDVVKQYIDLLALYKFNNFHWHLTDDQGWRIEIKKYPELTNVGATRSNTLIGHYTDRPVKYDNKEVSGYYTQEQIKEVVEYAKDRFINIIPEIEMPGHASAALAAYPYLGCTWGPYKVANTWGVFEDVLCTKDTTLNFMKDVLNEVVDLFPGKYIHIGGDECPKARWKTCINCQRNKRRFNLADEDQLQSYFIKEIEKHLYRKGKKLIGWDEILEGGLAPNATVMSWRGETGGVEAASQNHDVIMTPGSHCYFDHYQSKNPREALAIGGYTPISKVYAYEPIPANLDPKFSKFILGAQANLWTEYIEDEKKLFYMAFPRAIALSEVLWSRKEDKNYAGFLERLQFHLPWLKTQKINLTNAYAELDYTLSKSGDDMVLHFVKAPIKGKVLVEFKHNANNFTQEYPKGDSLILSNSIDLKAWYQLQDNSLCKPIHIIYNRHKAAGASIQFIEKPSPKYFSNENSIINGIAAPTNKYSGPEWLGMEGKNFEAIIDLSKSDTIDQIKFQLYNFPAAWIYPAKEIIVEASTDNLNYEVVGSWKLSPFTQERYIEPILDLKKNKSYRYLKIKVINHGKIAEGSPGAGHTAWLFLGEITVD